MTVSISKLAEYKLAKLFNYLIKNWSLQAKIEFQKKLYFKINQIKNNPYSCTQSLEYKGLYKCVITKQTTIFSRVSEEQKEIEIITIFDTRQNPNKLYKDL